jgi:hypothetical protein
MPYKKTHTPPMLTLEEAWKNQIRNDPYRVVAKFVKQGKYDKLAKILERKDARRAAAIPTILLHSNDTLCSTLQREMLKRGVQAELASCADIALRLSRDYQDPAPPILKTIAAHATRPNRLSSITYAEFKQFYQTYRTYGPISA